MGRRKGGAPCHPDLVAGGDAGAGPNLVLPLRAHHLRIRAADLQQLPVSILARHMLASCYTAALLIAMELHPHAEEVQGTAALNGSQTSSTCHTGMIIDHTASGHA